MTEAEFNKTYDELNKKMETLQAKMDKINFDKVCKSDAEFAEAEEKWDKLMKLSEAFDVLADQMFDLLDKVEESAEANANG